MKYSLVHAVRVWIPIALAMTVLSGLVAVSVQQAFRTTADDPQIQLAEDAATALSRGTAGVGSFAAGSPVDIATSVAPWVAVYDDSGRPLASSGRYAGALPILPDGVLAGARDGRERRVTWQPARGVRSAVVVTRVAGPRPLFVVAGRSLREVEMRVEALRARTLIAWAIGVAGAFAAAWLVTGRVRREPAPRFQT